MSNIMTGESIITQDQIYKIQNELLKQDQVELPTDHFFADGMYCRKVWRPRGTIIVGKIHKKQHFFMCTLGEIAVWGDKGSKILKSGDLVVSEPGTKRITLALTDAIGVTVHRTDKTNMDEIEEELIENEENSAFAAGNKLKEIL